VLSGVTLHSLRWLGYSGWDDGGALGGAGKGRFAAYRVSVHACASLFVLDGGAQVGRNFVGGAFKFAHRIAQGPAELWKRLGPKDQQHGEEDNDKLTHTQVLHEC